MNIIECRTFAIGRFTVQQRPRFDSPGWGQYLVFIGKVLIGKSFSVPNLDCCEWLYLQQRDQTFYAYSTERLTDKPYGYTAVHHHRRVRLRKATAKTHHEEAVAEG